jgi:zinc-binding alcohol dehydrogenase/oxidoreductase
MKAVVLKELGGPENLLLEDVPDPQPGPGEAVVRLKAAAMNHRDVWIRTGRYAGIKLPIILGSDGAGTVHAVGSGIDSSLVGRPVLINPCLHWGDDPTVQRNDFRILGLPDHGTYAEFVTVPAVNVHPKPEELSWEEAAAVPLAAMTAYRAAVSRGQIQSGETVVVTGIGGGVAVFVLQIVKNIGCKVLVTSSSDEKIERARTLGADGGVNYRTQDWVNVLREMTEGRGPDVIVDSAGGEVFEKALDLVRPGGKVITFGATLGPAKDVMVRRIFWKQLTVIGSTMGTPEEFRKAVELYSSGGLRPVIDKVFPLAEVQAAHKRMEAGEQFGRIVLTIPSWRIDR